MNSLTPPLRLTAEYEVGTAPIPGGFHLGAYNTLDRIREIVESLEDRGEWPEGASAVVTDANGQKWHLTDTWEPIPAEEF